MEPVVLILWRLRIYYWLIRPSHSLVFHLNVFLELIILNRVTVYEGRCHFLTREFFLELLRVDMVLELPESLQVLGMKELLLVVEIIKKLLVPMILSSDVLFEVDIIDIVLLRNDGTHRLQCTQLLLKSLARQVLLLVILEVDLLLLVHLLVKLIQLNLIEESLDVVLLVCVFARYQVLSMDRQPFFYLGHLLIHIIQVHILDVFYFLLLFF